LYRACEYRREKIVNILLDYKICIDNLVFTAVEPAVLQGYLPIIQILMERGLINKDNIVTFFRISCDHNKVDVVKYLLSYSAENSKSISEGFAYRLRHGCALNIDLLRIFVDHKLIAVTDEFLAGTIVSEQYDLAEFLIDKGANPRFNNNGILRHAMERCDTGTVRFLQTIGVKMEELKDELHTYFDLWSGSESALEMLLKPVQTPKDIHTEVKDSLYCSDTITIH
jgi:ankyrin repeat protein